MELVTLAILSKRLLISDMVESPAFFLSKTFPFSEKIWLDRSGDGKGVSEASNKVLKLFSNPKIWPSAILLTVLLTTGQSLQLIA